MALHSVPCICLLFNNVLQLMHTTDMVVKAPCIINFNRFTYDSSSEKLVGGGDGGRLYHLARDTFWKREIQKIEKSCLFKMTAILH